MRNVIFATGLCAAATILGIAEPAAQAAPATDACALVTPEQVGEIVGAKMSAGTNPSPGFTKTCTWTTKGVIVTLMLQGVDGFNAGKKALVASEVTPTSGVGDEAYYVVVANMVSLLVRKGNAAFKATVYSSAMEMDRKKSMEKALAQHVVGKI